MELKEATYVSVYLDRSHATYLDQVQQDIAKGCVEHGLSVPSKAQVLKICLLRGWNDMLEMKQGIIPVRFLRAAEEHARKNPESVTQSI